MNPCQGNTFIFRSSQQVPCLRLEPLDSTRTLMKQMMQPFVHLLLEGPWPPLGPPGFKMLDKCLSE